MSVCGVSRRCRRRGAQAAASKVHVPPVVPQVFVAIRLRLSTDLSSISTGTTGHVTPVRISSDAFDQSQ